MSDASFTQATAEVLLAMEKRRADNREWDYPNLGGFGGRIKVPIVSVDGRERFFLDLHRARIGIKKGTYQNRAREVLVLARLDFGGASHRNPDGEEVGSPHLHLYREGFGDKWAFPVPPEKFPNLEDPWVTLEDFMRFCNITEPPVIKRGLFT